MAEKVQYYVTFLMDNVKEKRIYHRYFKFFGGREQPLQLSLNSAQTYQLHTFVWSRLTWVCFPQLT